MRRGKDIVPSSALSIPLDAVRLISLLYVGTAAAAGHCGLVRLGVRHLLPSIGRGAAAGITTPVFRLRAGAVGFRHRDASVFASPLDTFVAILVQRREIFPQLLVRGRHGVAFAHCRELEGQIAKGVGMELVLMGLQKRYQRIRDANEALGVSHLQIAQLCELLPAALKLAQERLPLLVDNAVGPNIATLGEAFATTFAGVRTFAGVATLMCLKDVIMIIPVLPA